MLDLPPRFSTVLSLVGLAVAIAAGGCSSKAAGDVACDGGVCEPKPVFANGFLSSVLVTPYAVYAAERSSCGIYGADKPLKTSRMLVANACSVSVMARTDGALFWTTAPMPTEAEKSPKGMLARVADDDPMPVVIDRALDQPRGVAVLGGDTVYVAVSDGIRRLAPGGTQLERAVDVAGPQTLRAFGGALYWHDGFQTIYAWRPGDAKPSKLVDGADVRERYVSKPSDDPFEVDASGIYWMSGDLLGAGGTLRHAALAGGSPATILEPTGYVTAIALEEGAVYWSEADSFILPKETKIHRTSKSALGTSTVIGALTGEVDALEIAAEGLYIAASPSLSDFDFEKGTFERYGGPLLVLPRGVLDAR